MLVFTRKVDERIVVGNVTIRVLKAGRRKIKLGIEAPAEVPVHRGEVYDKLREETE